MKVYLVRHAEAVSKDMALDRPLSDEGREQAAAVAAITKQMRVEVTRIQHSGKIRARQTAEILARALAPAKGVEAVSGMAPTDDVKPMAEKLDDTVEPLMLVGHLPFMERLAGHMLTGDADQVVVSFTTAAIVCLEKADQRWQLIWTLTPEIALAGQHA
jgi:phosphohistidine phosphatase